MIGKTIARVDWDTIYFTDGTAIEVERYVELDWAEVQRRNHVAQGVREQSRMRRLESMLHPKDRQWLRQQRAAVDEKRRNSLGAFSRALEEVFVADMRADMNRAGYGFSDLFIPRRYKRKRRMPAVERWARDEAKGAKWIGSQIVVPILKKRP